MSARQVESGWGGRLVPVGLFLLALALRLFHLDHQSLWHDEAFTILVARQGFGAMVEDLVRDFNHPPLHYVVVWGAFRALGESVVAARLPSALAGAAAVPVLHLLGRRLYDARTGTLAALLLAFSQQALAWSQTARGYSQLLFFSLAATHLFLVALRDRDVRAWAGAVLCACLALYSHFYAAFVLAGCLLFLLLHLGRYRLPWSWVAGGIACAALMALPWLASGVLEEARSGRATAFMDQSIWRASSWVSVPDTVDAFNNGRRLGVYEDSPVWGVALGGLLLSLPALLALRPLLRRGDSEREAAALALLLVALPVLAAWLLGFLGLAYRVRYVAFALPPYYLLAARGLTSIRAAALRRAAVAACLAFVVLGSRTALSLPYRANYRDALERVEAGWREGDALVFSPWGEPKQWALYREDHPGLEVVPFGAVADGGAEARRVWLLTYLKPGARGKAYRDLEHFERAWARVERHELYLLQVGLYEPR